MSAPTQPFVAQLRAKRTVQMAPEGAAGALTLRVEMPEIWETIKVIVLPSERIVNFKVRVLEALDPNAQFHEDYVLKLRGWEVLDEQATLADAGAIDGSIFLITHRRRRPVR